MGYIILQATRYFETLLFNIGNHLTISVAGIFFFGFTVPYMAAAYGVAIAGANGVSFWLSIPIALLLALLTGWFFTLLYKRLGADAFAVFSVASILAFDALLRSWDSITGGVLGVGGFPRPSLVAGNTSLMVLDLIIVSIFLAVEYALLKAPFGRALQAHKESLQLLDSSGKSARQTGAVVILICSLLAGISGILGAWRIQFLDPSFGGIEFFIFGLTCSIIAYRPKIGWIVGATAVVLFLPELLRFFPFPETMFAHLRILTYAILLIFLVHRLSAQYNETKRLI